MKLCISLLPQNIEPISPLPLADMANRPSPLYRDTPLLNNDEHTHMNRANVSTDILDMAFICQNLAIHDLQSQIGADLGSDHLPIEISIDTTPHRNTSTNPIKYKFDQTDREVFESTLNEALGSADFSGHLSTSDLDKQSALQ